MHLHLTSCCYHKSCGCYAPINVKPKGGGDPRHVWGIWLPLLSPPSGIWLRVWVPGWAGAFLSLGKIRKCIPEFSVVYMIFLNLPVIAQEKWKIHIDEVIRWSCAISILTVSSSLLRKNAPVQASTYSTTYLLWWHSMLFQCLSSSLIPLLHFAPQVMSCPTTLPYLTCSDERTSTSYK